ncbi:hypothetical protein FEM48_ZijujUnG0042100 [Ziziphus jujuba var. spinosa]|uniref:very-long-chain 3-oxoacyl-CoA synthase n=1 Tax=Ziziphus jujuba var. spinosa TaxID=714518 RepID=A0A978U9A9_ZIZJJ|nr:hypothetical protein FEM48_ZijujUnG0042100 [Ziziphus jujuba var. spinosa]
MDSTSNLWLHNSFSLSHHFLLPLPHFPPLPSLSPTNPHHLPQTNHHPPQPLSTPPLPHHRAVGCTLSSLSHTPHLHWIICFPPKTPPSGPLFFWAYIFYLSKILEFLDTLLIILSGSISRLSFLHVYHHSTVVVMCYIWLQTSQSLFPVALVTNASVHVLMYGYYLLCAVGIRPKWKRVVTDCQIVQFMFSFAVSGRMLYLHFYGSGCSGMWGWCFNAVFNASLLYLFFDFHSKSYKKENGVHNRVDKSKAS